MSHTNAILVQAGTLRHCGWKQADTPQALHIWKIVARRGHAKMNIATADKTAGGSKSAMNYALGLTWNPCVDSFRTSSPTFSKIMLLTFFSSFFRSFFSPWVWRGPRCNQISFQTICARNKEKRENKEQKENFVLISLSLSLSLFTSYKRRENYTRSEIAKQRGYLDAWLKTRTCHNQSRGWD